MGVCGCGCVCERESIEKERERVVRGGVGAVWDGVLVTHLCMSILMFVIFCIFGWGVSDTFVYEYINVCNF